MIDSANYGAGAAVAPTGTKRHQIASSASRLRRPALPTEPRGQSKLFDGDWSYRFHNTKKYRHPVTGAALKVDAVLSTTMLNRLDRIPGIQVERRGRSWCPSG
jgi:hypothetical protein